jgi:hypothetical protein
MSIRPATAYPSRKQTQSLLGVDYSTIGLGVPRPPRCSYTIKYEGVEPTLAPLSLEEEMYEVVQQRHLSAYWDIRQEITGGRTILYSLRLTV